MSQGSESFREHRVWQALNDWDASLRRALDGSSVNVGESEIEDLARLRSVHSLAKNHLKTTDSHFLWKELLDHFATNAEQIALNLASFVNSGNRQWLQNANANANGIVNFAKPHSTSSNAEGLGAAKEATETYRQGLRALLKEAQSSALEVRRELDVLREQFAELSKQIAADRAMAAAQMSDFQSQFSSSQERRGAEHTESMRKWDERAGAALEELKTVAGLAATVHEKTRKVAEEDYKHSTEYVIRKIEAGKAKVDELVGIVTDKSIVAGHLGAANKAAGSTRFWHFVTLFAMVGLIAVGCSLAKWPLSASGTGGFDWSGFAARAFVAASFGVLASYGGVEAARYQRQERENRRKALELAALRPYVAELPKEHQDAFVIKIGEKMFGNSEPIYDTDAPSPTNLLAGMNNILKTVLENRDGKAKPLEAS